MEQSRWAVRRCWLLGGPAYGNAGLRQQRKHGSWGLDIPHEIGGDHPRFPRSLPHLRECQF